MPCDSETWREFLHKLLFSRFVSQWGDKGKPIFVNNKCIIMLKIFARVIKAMQDSWLCGQKNNAYDNKSSRKCIYSECICLEIPHSTNMAKDPDKQNCLKGKSTFVRKTSLIVTEKQLTKRYLDVSCLYMVQKFSLPQLHVFCYVFLPFHN